MMNAMLGRLLPLLLVLMWSMPTAVVAQAPKASPSVMTIPSSTWADVDSAARTAVSQGDVPGTVILIGQGDRVLYRKATGSRALVPINEPMTIDTIFDIASLTKVVATTPSVLLLWDQKRLDLDAPLGNYLKEFNAPAFRGVTVRRLLTHSAGMPDLPSREAMARKFPDAARLQARVGLNETPGSLFVYSDTGFILLAELVHRVSGETLDRFAQKHFYTPLGMRHTTFRPPESWRGRIAPTEIVNGGVLRGVVHDGNARLLGGVAGHAGLFSTADDLSRFCRMLLDGGALDGRRYLSDATIREMFSPE